MAFISHKFWMGFNSFVMLFLAINIGTVGAETDSSLPFVIALGYMIYMSVYLSKAAAWKVYALLGIGLFGALFYLLGMAFKLMPQNLHALAWTHIVLSLVLAAGSLAHLRSKK
jgi:hypothetical protein